MRKLKRLKMGSTSADEHTGKFNLLVDQAEMANAGAAILIDFYRSSLADWLIDRIYQGTVPVTLEDWKTKAIQLDYNRRLAQSYTSGGRSNAPQKKKKAVYKFNRYTPQSSKRDDDAMDVDRLAVAIQRLPLPDQKRLMEKGLCFNCGQPGHFAVNCPKKGVGPKPQLNKKSPGAKKNRAFTGKGKARNLHTRIQALVSELSDGEREEFVKIATLEGLDIDEEGEQDF